MAATAGRRANWIVGLAVAAGCGLVALAGAGVLAALLVPNFLDALQKAKQKRTLADMRAAGAALEAYREASGGYPLVAGAAALQPLLAARGWAGEELRDGWGNPLRYACLAPAGAGCESYELASGGSDGTFDSAPGEGEIGPFAVGDYARDVVLRDGLFARWPEGTGRYGAEGS